MRIEVLPSHGILVMVAEVLLYSGVLPAYDISQNDE